MEREMAREYEGSAYFREKAELWRNQLPSNRLQKIQVIDKSPKGTRSATRSEIEAMLKLSRGKR